MPQDLHEVRLQRRQRATGYDVDFPVQLGAFDGPFHDLHEAVQPLPFHELRATHTFINGRGYPDTVVAGALPAVQVDEADPGSVLASRRRSSPG